jgi:TolB protein
MGFVVNRRSVLRLVGGFACANAQSAAVLAQERYLEIRPGAFKPVTIAVTNFIDDSSGGVSSVITNNFKRSVYLAPIEPRSFPETIASPDQSPRADVWRLINAQFVVTGGIARAADGRLKSEFRLWEVSSGQQIAGQQYTTESNNARRVAHLISDAIFTKITGEKGWFDSRVVFVDETGSKEKRRKRLAIMDQDGGNVRYLTRGDDLVVTPRFSPSSQDVTYMSFGSDDPRVYLLNIETGQREVVGNFPGMTFSPRFSPDGQKIVMSLAQGVSTNIFTMDLHSKSTMRLTDAPAIDTSPSYSPDGARIVFESDRGGSQQIYVMGAGGGSANRISFGDGRYSTPVWSPRGDYIAFTKQHGETFAIGVIKPDGSGERILTEGFHNEGPTWAPNGLYLMFFRDPGGQSGAKIFMIDILGRGEFAVPTPSFASDPAWGPLLN